MACQGGRQAGLSPAPRLLYHGAAWKNTVSGLSGRADPGRSRLPVIDSFVDRPDTAGLGFERAEAAETGRPGYDPGDLLKLYLWLSPADPFLAAVWSRSAGETWS